VTRRLQLGLNGGVRAEDPLNPLLDSNDVIWYGFDLSMSLGRHWYWSGTFERTDGDFENNDQIYTSLVYRF